ncbi:hypothetical protein BD779DRAFT_1673218 [Infundibulicybe gibba]|nr:hypothetical protein BD779DRAFT_1673218 [Infundibulicybe gibba]
MAARARRYSAFGDRDVLCHSVVLRARSEFFSDLFGDEAWTKNRWNTDGTIVINLKHLHYHEMEYVLLFLCCGHDREIFDGLDFVQSLEELLDFMFNVIAAANEFLVDRLILLCSDVILQYANIHTACYILAEATHFHAQQLRMPVSSEDIFSMDEPAPLIPPEQPIPNTDPKRPMAVWKASSVPRADMKTIMAEAATTSPRHPGGSPLAVPQNVHRTSPSPSMNTRPPVQQNTPSRSNTLLQKPSIAQPLPRPASKFPSRAPPAPRGASPKYPGLGPVINPMRQAPAKSPGRNISGGNSGAMSFAAIQQLQLDQGGTTVRDKRSLVEIQEEERARQTEEGFLRWWAEEEQRIQLDAELAQAIAQSQQQQRKQPKGRKPIRKKKSVQPSGQAGMSVPPASRGPAVAVNSKDGQK